MGPFFFLTDIHLAFVAVVALAFGQTGQEMEL
jgi:hypothetical protein